MNLKFKNGIGVVGIIIGLVSIAVILIVIGFRSTVDRFKKRLARMDIYIEELDSGEITQLTFDGFNMAPFFSRDGKRIVFASRGEDQDGNEVASIKIMALEDRSVVNLVSGDFFMSYPSWGPRDQSIVYLSDEGGQRDIWIFDIGSGLKSRLTNDSLSEQSPLVSPDGKWVLFKQKVRDEGSDVYIVSTGGGFKRRVTHTANFLNEPKSPSWLTDSKGIVLISFVDLKFINLDGKEMDSISLVGLNNFVEPVVNPKNPDFILFKARPAKSPVLQMKLYKIFRSTEEKEIIRKASFLERGYNFSPDGRKIAYFKTSD